ncbi:hypothetical protein M8C21_008810, partial [Ambrosia artemisiifolia]
SHTLYTSIITLLLPLTNPPFLPLTTATSSPTMEGPSEEKSLSSSSAQIPISSILTIWRCGVPLIHGDRYKHRETCGGVDGGTQRCACLRKELGGYSVCGDFALIYRFDGSFECYEVKEFERLSIHELQLKESHGSTSSLAVQCEPIEYGGAGGVQVSGEVNGTIGGGVEAILPIHG